MRPAQIAIGLTLWLVASVLFGLIMARLLAASRTQGSVPDPLPSGAAALFERPQEIIPEPQGDSPIRVTAST